ncbi:ribosomal protein S18-alanine N-acetyltransferase [Lihuaxuella thermophila]|uniref:Ribosomal-protein-alanine N-acetyltransferase n=1 Tax=Lihuaxuella thermophila TaxID=1173111 RepID=A0A1H8G6X6_9BACL|nr:ribosomal protein S18-alanine N-acetyltransferase [Lihuaxuella thermophila]SEN39743.1 ribosomal-protein-alanine N-acetyltransferase [Lihuaxuella thermophila]
MPKKAEGEVAFRPMQISDLPQIELVENESFTAPWPRQAFYNELVYNQFAHYTVVTVDGKVVGYCGCWLILDEAHITNIAIHPDYRGRGLGEATLTHVMEMAKAMGATKMTLEVRVSNTAAQSLYEKLGFVRSGIRPKYYTDNQEDAIIMWVTLNEQGKRNLGTGNRNQLR